MSAGQAGEVSLDNEAFVSVPAGAADRAITITIEKASDAEQLIADRNLLSGAVFELLREGQRVEFSVEESPKGPRAADVRLLDS